MANVVDMQLDDLKNELLALPGFLGEVRFRILKEGIAVGVLDNGINERHIERAFHGLRTELARQRVLIRQKRHSADSLLTNSPRESEEVAASMEVNNARH